MFDPAQSVDDDTLFNPLPKTDPKRVARAVAAPPTLAAGGAYGRTETLGTLSGPAAGLTVSNPASPGTVDYADNSQSGLNARLAAMQKSNGSLDPAATAGSNLATINPADGTERPVSGGVIGSLKEGNEATARANTARAGMIDSMIEANGGNGIGLLGVDQNGMTQTDRDNQDKTQRWRQDDLASAMKRAGSRTERAAYGQALSQAITGENQQAVEQLRQQGISNAELARQGLTMRGQDLALQRAQERNDVITRGQDVRADVAGDRISSNEAIAGARIAERAGRPDQTGRLTTAQQRSNAEIDAARTAIAGLTPEEIKRKTANFTATGRENPDYDPTLAKSVSQANRRKFGDDQDFDQRQQSQPKQPAGTDGDVLTRFRTDQAMQGHKTGKLTDQGVEVFDAAGKLIGHYR